MGTLRARLVRHTFADRPDWVVVLETVPLGTIYKLYMPPRPATIFNKETGESRPVQVCLADGNGSVGMMVMDVLEIIGKPINLNG